MKRGETDEHKNLKRLAFLWARTAGLPLVGSEVRVPQSPYRADVVAMSRHPVTDREAHVALFECKQCRSDLLRDQADEPVIRAAAGAIAARVQMLREMLATHRPDLRRGESLFAEFDSYDFTGLRHDTLHQLEAEWEDLQRKLGTRVKFSRLHKYHSADYLYLVTEPGVLLPHEIPNGWGWLVREEEALVLKQKPVRHESSVERRRAWLESLALSGSTAMARALGVPFEPRE